MNTKQENEIVVSKEETTDTETDTSEYNLILTDNQKKALNIAFKTLVYISFSIYIILLIQELKLLPFIPKMTSFNINNVIWAKYSCLGLTIIALVLLFLNQCKKIKWHWFCGAFVAIISLIFTANLLQPTSHSHHSSTSSCDIFSDDECDSNTFGKPIIYLYPTEQTEVTVKLGNPQKLTHTYPKYKDKWQVIAQPNGDLTDIQTKRSLYALYWEGVNNDNNETTTGFIVKGEDTISFLEEKLAVLGLNEREANEFIIYWLPRLESSPYNLIYFKTIAEQDKNMPLYISPKPDTVIRVMMAFKNLKEPIEVEEQILPETPQRNGFTVVEWGGTDLTENIVR